MDRDDLQVDIFRDLDTDLIEIFNRTQLEEIERLARAGQIDLAPLRRGTPRLVRVRWFLVFPIVEVDFALLWRTHRPLPAAVARWLALLMTLALRTCRFVVIFVLTWTHVLNVVWRILGFINLVTFSENSAMDLLTYVLRDYPTLLTLKAQLASGEKQFLSVSLRNFHMAILLWAAKNISATCIETDGATLCLLNTQTLVFRFSDAMLKVAPQLELAPAMLTLLTSAVYLTYAFGWLLVSFNLLVFWFLSIVKRFTRFFDFALRFCKIAFKSFTSPVY